ncbi:MAG: hypothetical protein ABL956_05475 [Hyphomonadaceae bacterium]
MTTGDAQPGAKFEFDRLERRNVFLYAVLDDVGINGRDMAQHNRVELDVDGPFKPSSPRAFCLATVI